MAKRPDTSLTAVQSVPFGVSKGQRIEARYLHDPSILLRTGNRRNKRGVLVLAPASPISATQLHRCITGSRRSCSTGLVSCVACRASTICSPAIRFAQSRHTCCLAPQRQPRCLLTKRLHFPAAHARCGNVGVCADLLDVMFSIGELVNRSRVAAFVESFCRR